MGAGWVVHSASRDSGRVVRPLLEGSLLVWAGSFSSPPTAIDPGEFFLGGLCYWYADNPALFVPGPLVYAINLANKRTYLYSAYLAGLGLLAIWCAGIPHS